VIRKPARKTGAKKVAAPRRQSPKPKASLAPAATRAAAAVRASTARASAPDVSALFDRIATILDEARARLVRSVNSEMVLAYWHIGREIVEHLQRGAARAEYGGQLLETLSGQLSRRFGQGYSATNLKYFRLFYQAYSDRAPEIRHGSRDEFAARTIRHVTRDVSDAVAAAVKSTPRLEGFSSRLSWTHYRTLTKVEHAAARCFYEIEAEQEGWSAEHLERQIHTELFPRLLKSRDKNGVIDLASRGQVLERPADAIKHPYVLDFLDLPESHVLRETDLEAAILEKLQQFLLELGKGFAFVARQKRITFDDEEFYVDLVFYNIVLKCYLLIDLKLGKLAHQDVGQIDSYVRLFDDQYRTEGDGPTIGLILCAEKNEAVARYSVLHGNEQLFAAKYVTQLPSVEVLQRELARETRLLGTSSTTKAKRRQ
jgi:predicted nuclease of restriction endonuclease-like (RecB) superfamily